MLAKVVNTVGKSFWWGLGVGIFISFAASYIAWPHIPVDTEFRDGTKVILPTVSDPVGIYYPLDGAKVGGKFLVYGVGSGFENKGEVVVEDQKGQIIRRKPVEFLTDSNLQTNGVFVVLVDAGNLDESQISGLIRLYSLDFGGGKREIGKTHVRL